MDNNKKHYERQYQTEIPYKYKTNTRYQRYLIELLEKYMDKGAVHALCDVGCGQGLNTARFAGDFPDARILGVDLSEAGIAYAKRRWAHISSLSFACGDITACGLPAGEYDMVTAFEVLEHIRDWKKTARAMCRASGRYIMVSAPVGRMRRYEVKHGHYRNFKRGELESFFGRHGFLAVKTYYAGFPFWSPVTRDLLDLVPGDSTGMQEHLSVPGKAASLCLYYLYRYCSSKTKGDQFIGLFEKKARHGG